MIIVRTKNTFLNATICGEGDFPGVSRVRCASCPPCFDISSIEGDSLSTAPTVNVEHGKTLRGKFFDEEDLRKTQVVIVRNLPPDITVEMFRNELPSLGFRIALKQGCSFNLVSDSFYGSSLFIDLPDPGVAMSLFQLLHGATIRERKVFAYLTTRDACMNLSQPRLTDSKSSQSEFRGFKAEKATRRGEQHGRKIFVGGLSITTNASDIRMYFSQFGSVKDCGVVKDFRGISRRFGFCEFWTEESMKAVTKTCSHVIKNQAVGVRPYSLRE